MSTLRLGWVDPIIAARPTTGLISRFNYAAAVAAGAESLWVPDHLNSLWPRALWNNPKYCGGARLLPKADAFLEPWTMLGHTAARNRVRLHLGVAVTDTGRRNPAVTAQAAATLDLLTRGRAILGIGCGEREGNEPYGVEWSKPVARFEEAMATIRTLWNSNGELVNRDSEWFPLRNALFDVPAYKGKRPPIWIAAHGPRMLRAVGRYGDGYFPAFAHTPEQYAERLEAVRTAASDAGRDPMAITPAIFLFSLAGRTAADVEEALESEVIRATALNASDDFFARHGAQHPLGIGFSGAQDNEPFEMDEQTALSHIKTIPTAVVRDSLLCGTPDEIVERAAQWRDAGVRHVVLANIGIMQRRLGKGLASIPALVQAARKLKML